MNPYETIEVDYDEKPVREYTGIPDEHVLDELRTLLVDSHETAGDVVDTIYRHPGVYRALEAAIAPEPVALWFADCHSAAAAVNELTSIDSTVTQALANVFSGELDAAWREGQQQLQDDRSAWAARY